MRKKFLNTLDTYIYICTSFGFEKIIIKKFHWSVCVFLFLTKMIVYVPGRMPDHVGPYGAARYPGLLGNTLPSYYHPISTYLNHHHHQQQQHHHSTTRLYNENFNLLHHHPIDIPIWTTTMPSEEDLVASQNGNRLGGGIGASPSSGLPSDGPPSPSHSDSDASNSSLELGSIRRGENAQLKCRWDSFFIFISSSFFFFLC